VAVRGNALEDVSRLANILLVMQGGRIVCREPRATRHDPR
jgi:hypothetical protein